LVLARELAGIGYTDDGSDLQTVATTLPRRNLDFVTMFEKTAGNLCERFRSAPALRRRHNMQEYRNDKFVVRYDPAICIHASECVRGLPSVFNLSRKPWIDVNSASAAAVIEQVKLCPSGALTYELLK
jgi:uncharacterized Fe-S cluster protein YjdI